MKNNHEKRVFYLLACLIGMAVLYVYLITFISIPKENIRFADTTLGFFLGTLITSILSYYIGSNPKADKKNEGPAGATTATIQAEIHTEPAAEQEPKTE